MALVKSILLLLGSAPFVVNAQTIPNTLLIGQVFDGDKYVFELPRWLSKCPTEVRDKANRLAELEYRRLGLKGSPEFFANTATYQFKTPKKLKTLPKSWVRYSISGHSIIPLELTVSSSEFQTSCWKFASPNVHGFHSIGAANWVIASSMSLGTTQLQNLEIVAVKREQHDNEAMIESNKERVREVLRLIPSLAKRLPAFMLGDSKNENIWGLGQSEKFEARVRGKTHQFQSISIHTSNEKAASIDFLVNLTTKQYCYLNIASEDGVMYISPKALLVEKSEKATDVWLITKQFYEGQTQELVKPITTNQKQCRLTTLVQTDYRGV